MKFSGSYHPNDVEFLLKPIKPEWVSDLGEKERLIQSGTKHYSEMLSRENLPSPSYLELFWAAYAANHERMARDCLKLAAHISERRPTSITLVSLARAGTPIGVILKHLLTKVFSRGVAHYSVSIIRDRGIDEVAIRHILASGNSPESIVFVDGWTGKGVITHELRKSIELFNFHHAVAIDPGLYVLSDLAGVAACAVSCEDYLIPSSILNATVSGLVSRSILNNSIGPTDFHGCVYYNDFEAHDLSQKFVGGVVEATFAVARREGIPRVSPNRTIRTGDESRRFIRTIALRYGIDDINLIKPGIGEATRVLLRRSSLLVILRRSGDPDVAHIEALAAEKGIGIVIDEHLPYKAISLIRSMRNG